jgi:hypothetical protein
MERKSRRLRWTGHVARMREMRNAYITLYGKLKGATHHLRDKHRSDYNIKIYILVTRNAGLH